MTDQQRADLRKSQGFALDTMPFLDSWSEGGVDFQKAYTPNPICLAARCSLFTGRYPSSHQVRSNQNVEDIRYTKDILDIMKDQGYRTAICGKNHTYRRPAEDFDYAHPTGHLGIDRNQCRSEGEKALSDALDYESLFIDLQHPAPGGVEAQHPYRNVTDALSFLDEVGGRNPFFLWVSLAEPHNPYQVPEPYFDMFPPETLPAIMTNGKDLDAKGAKFIFVRDTWNKVLGENHQERLLRDRSNYYGMLRLIDDQFKRFIEGLENRGLSDDTIVVYLSDHGDFVGEYGLMRKGPELPEVLTHIPMVWKGPGIEGRGKDNAHFVNIVDILPTLCGILGVEIPFGVQGKDIMPLLHDVALPEREFDTAYSESGFGGLYFDEKDALTPQEEGACHNGWQTFDCLDTWTQAGQARMVRKGDWKLQLDMLGNGYLYNLKDDPHEINNLYDNPAEVETKADMLAELMASTLRAEDPLPPPNHRYRVKREPNGYWFQDFHQKKDEGVVSVEEKHFKKGQL